MITWPKVNDAVPAGSVYADVVTHCQNWRQYLVGSDRPSSAHECTHGINSDIRNAQGKNDYVTEYRPCALLMGGPSMTAHEWRTMNYRPRPIYPRRVFSTGSNVNAFYVLNDRACVLPEPPFRKHEIIPYIPKEFQKSRYGLYVVGQTSWDAMPLYVYDEWSAYINGGITALEIGASESGEDWLMGPLEFVAYALAVCMAAKSKGCLTDDLKTFTVFQLDRVFELYLTGKDVLPWQGQDDLYQQYKSGAAGKMYRDFMAAELQYTVPPSPQPPPDPNPWGP